MRFTIRALLTSVLTLCVCQVSVLLAAEKEQTEQQLQQVKQQIKQLQQRLDNKRKQYSSVTRTLRSTEKKINSAAKILRATRSQIVREKQTLKNNKKQELQLERNKSKHQDILAHQIRSAYSSGRQEYLKLLLNQEQPEKLGRMFSYYDYLNKARTKSIKELGETLVQLTQVQKDIQANIKELALLEQAQVKEQKRLLSLKEQRKKEVKQLAASIASQDKKLSHLRENEEELESLLHQMQKALEQIFQQQNLEGLAKYKGKLTWPLSGRLALNYGEPINRGIRSNGIRIAAQEGKDVAAVFHGRVVFSDWFRGFGLLVIVDHGKGYMSLYGNNQSLFKDVGDWVEAGEMIASVGQSGGQKTPGLYFEIRHQGKARNPMQWIRG
ncbi:murein hydrolase activator EnvC family protein [Pleionea mediterranea]|uniref:Septal ring factor EnvC (AmiA/AmiB activator) n=1 Tax=Pleionea mediterranea TaxID=523701 RepID=A0A316FWR1_9GAMM|nr:peptidoglycan DD-metalloendopeptidase family protein [Pleionea mediterranea]PWK53018.1 septal ring factor EnvC (AmiA/AmiB activator) [Pleionea mediterranea]